MRDSQIKPGLFFIHIPRTGGTTLGCYLRAQFQPQEVFPGQSWPELVRYDPGTLHEYRYFGGHYEYNLLEILPSPCRVVTFLRDPVDRVLSWYAYLKYSSVLARRSVFEGRTLREALRQGSDELKEASNFQTYLLSFDLPIEQVFRNLSGRILSLRPVPRSSKIDLALAKERIDQIDFVGIFEEYADSVRMLANHFGWGRRGSTLERSNASEQLPPDVDDVVREELAELNALDIELYQYARKRFDEQRRNLLPE